MRMICLVFTALFLLQSQPSRQAQDVVLVVDVSGMTQEEAGAEPWLAAPCLNPAHHYYFPAGAATSEETYPARSGAPDTAREYRFQTCFLLEAAAVGWRPWENHYRLDETGKPVTITNPDEEGCIFLASVARARAEELIHALLAEAPARRVALCCVGAPGDERFCVNFTRDAEKLVTALYAAPASGLGDVSSALNKAGEYLARRRADDRRARAALVIVLADEMGVENPLAPRAYEEARRLEESAALLWVSPFEADLSEIMEQAAALPAPGARGEAPPSTIYPDEGSRGLSARAR